MRRRLSFALCSGLIVPMIAVLGWIDGREGRLLESALVLSMAGLMSALCLAVMKLKDSRHVYRVAAFAALPLLTYEVAIGASSGFSFLWLYLFPTLVMVLLGAREGLFWLMAVLTFVLPVMLTPLAHDYSLGVTWRFLITFGVVTVFSYGLETSRRHYEKRLRRERASLREALAQVQILRGLLPLCPCCKKVRHDEGGYWEQIEVFFSRRTNIRFSHGLCPICVEEALAELE